MTSGGGFWGGFGFGLFGGVVVWGVFGCCVFRAFGVFPVWVLVFPLWVLVFPWWVRRVCGWCAGWLEIGLFLCGVLASLWFSGHVWGG
jgi:hypothetical protein